MALALQRSFDEMGSALVDTDFVVFDLETTGGSHAESEITEIGAVKVRAGEVLGEFATLVNPGVTIPPYISALTGITDLMVAGAEPIERVLPTFLEFIGDTTLVAHNASFDTGFLRANAARLGYPIPGNPVVCTVRLARRLVRDEVPNLKLETLAHALRARTAPTHRALDDARATTDVFHALLELSGRWGVTHLDDLLWFQSAKGHPSRSKVRLTEDLPRARGVYFFRSATDAILYVGKATDLRTRVRSYFGGDDRRKIDDLLRETERIDHIRCATDLDCSVLEARLIRRHSPPYNRAQRGRASQAWLRLTAGPFPRLTVARAAAPGALGPLTRRVAESVREALEDASPLRTCSLRLGPKAATASRCVRGQVGRCPAPCDGARDPEAYAASIEPVVAALGGAPDDVLQALGARIDALSAQCRYEEAATVRDRAFVLIEAISTARLARTLAEAGRLAFEIDGTTVEIDAGALTSVGGAPLGVPADDHPDEPRLIARWLARNQRRLSLRAAHGTFAEPIAGGATVAAWRARLRAVRAAT